MKNAEINDIERIIYSVICRNRGIKAKEIARRTGVDKAEINRLLYASPFIHELCYRDNDYFWHGLIRQARPHTGLRDFCGYYGTADDFLKLPEDDWLAQLMEGCRDIGRNLNDNRGLIHSFRDARQVMTALFSDLAHLDATSSIPYEDWEICFELRIKKARHIRIYADVLVITENKVFSLEFKMKDTADPEEKRQAVKYAGYLDVIFGDDYEIIPSLVLTRTSDLYRWEQLPGSTVEVPVCSHDMLFNLFDEFIGFLE